MDQEARAALATVRRCIEAERFIITSHFAQRMDQRGLMWPDVQVAIEDAADCRDDGSDRHGRPKWIVAGDAADGGPIEIVCVLDEDDVGETTVLITLYWS